MLYLKTSERCPVSSRPEPCDRPITMVTRVYSRTPAFDGTDIDTQTTRRERAAQLEREMERRGSRLRPSRASRFPLHL